jgi:AcrR family transcriptional regulator
MPAPRRPVVKPRKRPRQERARATVDAILQATAYILRRRGYAELTTNGIAEKAGVNIASLYQYFPNKEAILAELLRRHAAEGRSKALEVVRASRSRSFASGVRLLVDGMLAEHSVDPALHRVLTTEALRLGLPRVETDADAAIEAEVARWVASTKRKNADLALWIARTAVHAVVHLAFVERARDAERPAALADELTRLVVGFLRAPRAPRQRRAGD